MFIRADRLGVYWAEHIQRQNVQLCLLFNRGLTANQMNRMRRILPANEASGAYWLDSDTIDIISGILLPKVPFR